MGSTITQKDAAAVFEIFKNNPAMTDKDVSEAASAAGMSEQLLRETAYLILGTFAGGGRSVDKKLTRDGADPEQLAMGIEVEHEHVISNTAASELIAQKIALDHLAELPQNYYTLLAEMEKKSEKEQPKFSDMAKKLIGA